MFGLLLIFHLIGSSVWIGGHLILSIAVLPAALRSRDPAIISQFEARFEKIGVPALLLQIITGVWIAYFYVGNLLDVFDFAYSQHTYIAIKLLLLLATLLIAAHARLRLIRNLKEENLVFLAVHILTITTIALALLFFGIGIRIGGW